MSNFERIPGNFTTFQVDESLNCVMIELKNMALSEKNEAIKNRDISAINLIATIRRLPYFNKEEYKNLIVYELVELLKEAYDEANYEVCKLSKKLNEKNQQLERLSKSVDYYQKRWDEISAESSYEYDSEERDIRETLEEDKSELEELRKEYDYILIDCPAGIEQGFQTAIAAADCAIVVTMPEISAVRDADKIIGELGRADKENIKLEVD